MAEKEGFEPSIPFWGIHDFQSCALGQLRDFSMKLFRNQPEYNNSFSAICQDLFLQNINFFNGQIDSGKAVHKNRVSGAVHYGSPAPQFVRHA